MGRGVWDDGVCVGTQVACRMGGLILSLGLVRTAVGSMVQILQPYRKVSCEYKYVGFVPGIYVKGSQHRHQFYQPRIYYHGYVKEFSSTEIPYLTIERCNLIKPSS